MNVAYKSTPKKLSPSGRLENRCARKMSKSCSVRQITCIILYLTLQGEWSLCCHWFSSNMRRNSLGGRTVRNFQEDQRITHVSTHVASSEGREPLQDVYCYARAGYWSCPTPRRGWQGVFGDIRGSMST
jgi:hypothetical protein